MLGISEAAREDWISEHLCAMSYEMLQEAPFTLYRPLEPATFRRGLPDERQACMGGRPREGKLKYTGEEFCRCWLSAKTDGEDTGVALLLEPTPEFYAQEDEGKDKL